mmetsp:Transcript_93743/g.180895  ORF Transcript_93743/g.180895 Transcript_93743/m.180895 type:complete len:566 (+) Transcript_93743:65-1762(+)
MSCSCLSCMVEGPAALKFGWWMWLIPGLLSPIACVADLAREKMALPYKCGERTQMAVRCTSLIVAILWLLASLVVCLIPKFLDPLCRSDDVTVLASNHTEAEVDYALCSFAPQFVSWDRRPSDMAIREIGALIVGKMLTEPDAPAYETYGCQVVQWLANMAIAKFLLPQLCGSDELEIEQVMARKAIDILADVCPGNGTIFTSSPPKSAMLNVCAGYPSKQAATCHSLGHSHLVSGAFLDQNFAALRAADVDLSIDTADQMDLLKQLRHMAPICKGVLKDALCLDAFPPCRGEERTPCIMVCYNLQVCFQEVFYFGKPSFQYNKIREGCSEVCWKSGRLDGEVNTKLLFGDIEDPLDVLAPAPSIEIEEGEDKHSTQLVAVQIAGVGALAIALSLVLGSIVFVARRGILKEEPSSASRWLRHGGAHSGMEVLKSKDCSEDDVDIDLGALSSMDNLRSTTCSESEMEVLKSKNSCEDEMVMNVGTLSDMEVLKSTHICKVVMDVGTHNDMEVLESTNSSEDEVDMDVGVEEVTNVVYRRDTMASPQVTVLQSALSQAKTAALQDSV